MGTVSSAALVRDAGAVPAGIPRAIEDLQPGHHVCCIHADEAERIAAVVPYVRAGLARHEQLTYIADRAVATVLGELRAGGLDVDRPVETGQLILTTADDAFAGGALDPEAAVALLAAMIDRASRAGYAASRVVGEAAGAFRASSGPAQLVETEARLDARLPGSGCTALCLYDRSAFDPDLLLEVLRTHPYVAIGERIVRNPSYLPPARRGSAVAGEPREGPWVDPARSAQAQRMETLGRLARDIAHDINNLLAVVIGNAELARAGLAPDDPRAEAIADIEAAAKRGASLTRQLVAFGGRGDLAPVVLDLHSVVGEMSELLRCALGDTVTVTFAPAQPPLRVRADPAQLGQILVNLAVNARDTMPAGGTLLLETAAVTVGVADPDRPPALTPGRYATLAVRDTGGGTETEAQAHLYEPFFTTKGPRGGSGQGLAVAREIARQAGGELVLVASAPGEGSTFMLYLPIAEARVPETPGRTTPSVVAGSGSGSGSVLIVEDDPAVRRLARRALEIAGYGVIEAGDGAEALRLLESGPNPFTLVISDMIMPVLGGYELARHIASTRPQTRVLLMSGYPGDLISDDGTTVEGIAFIGKPFSFADLTAKVREVLEGS